MEVFGLRCRPLFLVYAGGDDFAEDVEGGMERALQLGPLMNGWRGGFNCLIHMADAPGHGMPMPRGVSGGDDHKEKRPSDGKPWDYR